MGRKSVVDWDAEIEEYLQSGKTYRMFCEGKDYSVSAFRNRLYRYRKNHQTAAVLPATVVKEADVRTIMVNGWELTVDENTDMHVLHLVLQAMKG